MTKPTKPAKKIDAKLAALEVRAASPAENERRDALCQALADSSPVVVRKAAQLAVEYFCYDTIPAQVEAFERFCGEQAAKRDPNCLAKSALAKALYELDYLDVEFYRRGLQLYQQEPVWGGSVDTAVDVRCSCAFGLAATSYGRAVVDLVALLVDQAAAARAAAVQALALLEPLASEAVLRQKVLSGDEESWVLGECFTALLKLEPDESIEFVAGQLVAGDVEIAGQAALALGESRLEEAFEPLATAWHQRRIERGMAKILLQALALHRSERATSLLLRVIHEASAAQAEDAIDALLSVRNSDPLRAQITQAVESRHGPAIATAVLESLQRDDHET